MKSSYLANKYLERFRIQSSWKPSELVMQVRKDLNIQISISQAYWAKRKAMEIINGSTVEQYSRLWDYTEEIRRTNEGSTVKMLFDT